MTTVVSEGTRTSLAVTLEGPADDVVRAAALAEELGYHAIWRPEGAGEDAFVVCAAWAMVTSKVGIGTGVASALTRPPSVIGRAALTLSAVSSGRFRLGLGAGNPSPAPAIGVLAQVREAVNAVRTEYSDATHAQPTPIYLAALGPRMIELSATIADGVLLNWVTRAGVSAARRRVADTAFRVGRDPSRVRIAAYVRVGSGTESETRREVLEQLSLFGKHRWYARHFSRMGVGAEYPRETDVRELVVWGSRRDVALQLEDFRRAGADEVVVRPLGDGDRWWRAAEVAAPGSDQASSAEI